MLKISNLTKNFGETIAVNNISFSVNEGEIFGLLGENGAGKTTTLRMISTMLQMTSGKIDVCGYDVKNQSQKVRENIGILFGGEAGLYDRLTVYENVKYFGELNDMKLNDIKDRFDKLSKIFQMDDFINIRAGKLSKGMKQKAAFARSIIHNPKVMLLDEPTSGLDVSAIRSVHNFIEICKSENKAVIFSSHTMSEVNKLCDKIGVINKGNLVCVDTIDGIKENYGDDLEDAFIKIIGGKKNES
ncbi:MAG: ATP-binding cassette domain-containing protein [Clostridiales bacterium]